MSLSARFPCDFLSICLPLSLSSNIKCCVRSSPIHTCPPLHSLLETPVFVFDRVCVHRIRRRELFFYLSLFLSLSLHSPPPTMSKRIPPRRRETISYPSSASSIDSVSSCSSFDSIDASYSTPSSPTYTEQFSFEPLETDESKDGIPRGAKVFKQNVWKVPERMKRRERWELSYSANLGTNLLEPVSLDCLV